MGTIKIKRGLSTNLPAHPALGEILYTTDTKRFYVGNGAEAAPTGNGVTKVSKSDVVSRIYLITKKDDELAKLKTAKISDLKGRTLMVGGGSPPQLRALQQRVLLRVLKTYSALLRILKINQKKV